jgi:hypothetical protein
VQKLQADPKARETADSRRIVQGSPPHPKEGGGEVRGYPEVFGLGKEKLHGGLGHAPESFLGFGTGRPGRFGGRESLETLMMGEFDLAELVGILQVRPYWVLSRDRSEQV